MFKFNKWYDELTEPKRFFVFLGMFLPFFLVAATGKYLGIDMLHTVGWTFIILLLVQRLIYQLIQRKLASRD